MYCTSPTLKPETAEILRVPLADRWRIYYRLQDLQVPCGCTDDGQLWAEIQTPVAALLVHSTISSFVNSRQALVNQLDYCWSL